MFRMKSKFCKPAINLHISTLKRSMVRSLLIVNIVWFIIMLVVYGNDLREFMCVRTSFEMTLERPMNVALVSVASEEFGIESQANLNTNKLVAAITRLTQKPHKTFQLNRSTSLSIDNSSVHRARRTMAKKRVAAHGEMGKPVYLAENMSAEMSKAVADGWRNHQFNQYVSDMISVQRTLPDIRDEWCKQTDRHLKNLPVTDVIICFYNEAWSTLLRTVHSVLNRSPAKLINKVILVDDYSDMEHTKAKLVAYFKSYTKVRIIRASKREGLTRARLLGARHATAPVLTFLDSHCECGEGWLEPLLERIERNATTVVYPNIAIINSTTFEYTNVADLIGGFNWKLLFDWIAIPKREQQRRKHAMAPVHSPTMPGGIFSINRAFFEHLGTYDSGFNIWGAENLELSFKIWMCGGTLEMLPCSFVGHIFRLKSPYNWLGGVSTRNFVRLAEVWLDNYAKYYYRTINFEKGDFGDIKSRIKLRKSLNCKSFKWYVKNVYPELEVPKDLLSAGEIRNLGAGGIACLDMKDIKKLAEPVGLWPCHGKGGNQHWIMTDMGEIRHGNFCLDYDGWNVLVYECHGEKGNQQWFYILEYRQLIQESSKWCLAISANKERVTMEQCDQDNLRQQWLLEQYDSEE